MAALSSYEELRKKKLEENKRKIEELKLTHISASLREAIAAPIRSQVRLLKRKAPGPVKVRRSERVAILPRPKYWYSRKEPVSLVYATDEEREYAIEKAIELENSLGSAFPTFVKPMIQSYVKGNSLALPAKFSRKHLPEAYSNISLIDEDDVEFDTRYVWYAAKLPSLTAGWGDFSKEHKLVDGDALVFQLTTPTTFKVYIIRASGYHDK